MEPPQRLLDQLDGQEGNTRQKAARLVIDLADTAKAEGYLEAVHAHVSGVSVITGGHGLRRFLQDLSADGDGQVAIPTTLNSAGCDREKMEEMDIQWPDFLEQQFEIVQAYEQLGIDATLSCTPYDRGIEAEAGIATWAESNAVCFCSWLHEPKHHPQSFLIYRRSSSAMQLEQRPNPFSMLVAVGRLLHPQRQASGGSVQPTR